MSVFQLWDFVDGRLQNVILQWVRDERLSKQDRAKLNQKLDRLIQMDFQLAWNTKLLDGPIDEGRHVYKLVIHGSVMLRPMLCKGPIDNHAEYTLLEGAIEKGGKLPSGSMERAAEHRRVAIADPSRRCIHERIP